LTSFTRGFSFCIHEPGFGNVFSLGLHLPLLVVIATVVAAVVSLLVVVAAVEAAVVVEQLEVSIGISVYGTRVILLISPKTVALALACTRTKSH